MEGERRANRFSPMAAREIPESTRREQLPEDMTAYPWVYLVRQVSTDLLDVQHPAQTCHWLFLNILRYK